jgi:hypothetical protein
MNQPAAACRWRSSSCARSAHARRNFLNQKVQAAVVHKNIAEGIAHREGLASLFLSREHVVDQSAAMENALLLTRQGVHLLERQDRPSAIRGTERAGRRWSC